MSFSARVEDEIDQASTSKPFALRTMEYRKDKDNIQFRFKCDNDANANEGNYKIDSNWQGFKFEKGSSSSFPLIDLEQQQIKFNE